MERTARRLRFTWRYGITFASGGARPLACREAKNTTESPNQLCSGRRRFAETGAGSRYVGSPEHKDAPSFAGSPRPRADASICDQRLRHEDVETWLRTAIERGAFGEYWEGAFPRYVWYKHEGTVYEPRLVNRESGEYKGYPLADDEWPPGLHAIYE